MKYIISVGGMCVCVTEKERGIEVDINSATLGSIFQS